VRVPQAVLLVRRRAAAGADAAVPRRLAVRPVRQFWGADEMSRHATHAMHGNSLQAYAESRPALSARCQAIVDWLRLRQSPASDRQIMEGLGFSDMNAVRPRISELLERGVLREWGACTDARTGKTVRLVELPQRQPAKPVPVADLFPALGTGRGLL